MTLIKVFIKSSSKSVKKPWLLVIFMLNFFNGKVKIRYYTFIACWWGKYENLFTQEYHIPWGQHPMGIWYWWGNNFSYFLFPYNVLLYRMKSRKHIHVKYCWHTYLKSIGTLSQTWIVQMFQGKLLKLEVIRVLFTQIIIL